MGDQPKETTGADSEFNSSCKGGGIRGVMNEMMSILIISTVHSRYFFSFFES